MDTTNDTEKLINRVRAAVCQGLTGPEIAEHFSTSATPEEIWLAYMAAKIIDRTPEEIAS